MVLKVRYVCYGWYFGYLLWYTGKFYLNIKKV